jgi:2-hydroxycyclohexanecarboxyl-CoA dehydrogenase
MDSGNKLALGEKSAVVTGSTDGIGKAIALRLGELGASITVNGRDQPKGESVVEGVKERGGDATFHAADINNYEEVTGLMNAAVDAFGDIDILVTSGAAASGPAPDFFENMEPDQFLEWCEAAYVNRLYSIKAALEYLRDGGGRVVTITADAGKVATPGEVGPGGAAAALMMATRVLANEFARYDITVNAVSLSAMRDTPAEEGLMPESDAAHVFEKAFEQQSFDVLSDDVAEAVVYLAGNTHAKPITGQIVSVNGGISFPG